MADEYTPTTDEIREQYVAGAMVTGFAYSRNEARSEFDRWLAGVKADLLEEQAREIDDEAETLHQTALGLTGDDNTRYHAYAASKRSVARKLFRVVERARNE